MMIDRRLINIAPDSKKYIALNVALQWCGLIANIMMMTAIAGMLAALFMQSAYMMMFVWTAIAAVVATGIRFCLHDRCNAYGIALSSKAVKRTLRETIYKKLLRMGSFLQSSAYRLRR